MAEESKNWWQTLPGILTAIAGVITAITGFLLAINQSGCFHKNVTTNEVVQTHVDSAQGGNNSSTTANVSPEVSPAVQEKDTGTLKDPTIKTTLTDKADEIDLISPENGGNLIAASSDKWKETIDGSEDWVQLDNGIGQQAIYGFKNGKPATFHSFAMLISETADYNIKEFELLAGNDSPTGKFTSLGTFKTVNLKLTATPYQVFSFDTVTAKYLKFKLISTYNWLHPAAHEFQLWGKLNEK